MTAESSRQSFLGENSDQVLASCKIGIIGLSGGGSHIAQQAAHVGVGNYVVIDPKRMAEKHSHRIVGATAKDVERKTPKVRIAQRVIKNVRPYTKVDAFDATWQEKQLYLRDCTTVFGCVDSYSEREQLERFCRRFLIPYIDVGMDVFASDNSYHISGQTILSSAGQPCLRCMGGDNGSQAVERGCGVRRRGAKAAGGVAEWGIGLRCYRPLH